jgi:hypothetical protein
MGSAGREVAKALVNRCTGKFDRKAWINRDRSLKRFAAGARCSFEMPCLGRDDGLLVALT